MKNRIKSDFALMLIVSLAFLVPVAALTIVTSRNESKAYVKAIEKCTNSIENLVSVDLIYEAIDSGNMKHEYFSLAEIEEYDLAWQQTSSNTNIKAEILETEASQYLADLKDGNPKIAEIFVTDIYGLNAAQSNLTSDFYQADEAWWQDTYSNGEGKTHYGEIEFDESAYQWSVPVYIPLRDEEGGIVGILKASLDVNKLR